MTSIVPRQAGDRLAFHLVTDPAPKSPLPVPGNVCTPDPRPGRSREPHDLIDPEQDAELQQVHAWLTPSPVERALTRAVDDAIKYVLDGSRTGRFDLMSPDVDSDERASVGTKMQYRILSELKLVKEPPLDTTILGIPVELKATVRSNWMIPTEGQCEICLLVQVDAAGSRYRTFIMRTHRAWLREGANKDGKRGVVSAALSQYALPVLDWTSLPPEPLKRLTQPQLDIVFAPRVGQTERLTALFGYLPDVVVPRSSIETVCAGNRDPIRRARQAKPLVAERHGLTLLCGTWREDLDLAASRGFDISGDAWVALTPEALVRPGTA
nr:NaeI family type II restriction endonuclease [Cellulosimicrobium sp. MM]